MLEHTINSMESLTSKELSTVALGLAKTVQNILDTRGKNQNSIYHQTIHDDSSNLKASFFHPFERVSSHTMQLFDSHRLACLS